MDLSLARVLIVDGDAGNLMVMSELLQESYNIMLASNGRSAQRILAEQPLPDLILLDGALDGPDALTLCRLIQADAVLGAIPVIVLAGRDQIELERQAFQAGAADVVGKPLCAETLMARVTTHLRLTLARARLDDQHAHIEELVQARTREVVALQDATILAVASLAETRDDMTVNHLRRTQHYLEALARQLQGHPRFADELSEPNIALLFKAAPLHDIGKIGLPESVLLKPGRLSDEEFAIMKRHTVYGRDAILAVERHLGGSNRFLRYAREIAYSHQEKYDGSGYPEGLVGDAIPVAARLMAVADVYDALISRRIYKPTFTHETAVELIRHESGEHFDPDVVDAMLVIEDQMMAIARRFPDAEGV